MTKEDRFHNFVEELTKLSYKYDIVIETIGGVTILDEDHMTHIHYGKSYADGNLTPYYWSDEDK